MPSAAASFKASVQQWLKRRPRRTANGVVSNRFRSAEFGAARGGRHEPLQCWVYQRSGSGLEMLFAFYQNFTPYDLICKVLADGSSLQPGEGASIQFNSDRCVRALGRGTWSLSHHGRVTAGETIRENAS